ncbi:hypothetical protein LOTGIDRAFT_156732 [Lottia gigantea]|uniref:Uncharacterized protein n=1 Tax=Lottia gigantea TaxID=225164 RepID=V4BA61_LOTGI|nr:hypothetical protein LOTGIDRAFT_156732 [Lottia gigantea]ESP02787.1 hypothetical protein LOTGIDRAFT_156732 [Lottia gigantea]
MNISEESVISVSSINQSVGLCDIITETKAKELAVNARMGNCDIDDLNSTYMQLLLNHHIPISLPPFPLNIYPVLDLEALETVQRTTESLIKYLKLEDVIKKIEDAKIRQLRKVRTVTFKDTVRLANYDDLSEESAPLHDVSTTHTASCTKVHNIVISKGDVTENDVMPVVTEIRMGVGGRLRKGLRRFGTRCFGCFRR